MWSQVAGNDFQGAEVHLHSGQRTCEVLRLPLQECASAPAFTPAVLERQCGFDPGAPEIFLVTPGKIRVGFIVKELSMEGETEPHPETSRKPVTTCKACDFATINEVCVANVSFFFRKRALHRSARTSAVAEATRLGHAQDLARPVFFWTRDCFERVPLYAAVYDLWLSQRAELCSVRQVPSSALIH